MDPNWENRFQSWAKAPGQTEQTKCDNAERAVTKAIRASYKLVNRNISVFPQGSYRNRTNVRADSDVDICILCTDSMFSAVPPGMSKADFGIDHPATYTYSDYKNDIQNALRSHFRYGDVVRGNKAFNVHENTYRVYADVVACFEFRRYQRNGTYLRGTAFVPDNAPFRTINWPNQNYDNGVAKNTATNRRFKAVVRILKNLRNYMAQKTILDVNSIPSYLIECLVWNVPNEGFGHNNYTADVQYALAHLYNNTRNDEDCKEWGETNELKYLFRGSQAWTRDQANTFLLAAWNFLGPR